MDENLRRKDIFKILSHETRRKIILFIGERGSANFTQLSRIEPKPGKLYYHLNLMRDLIAQDEDNFYYLTPLGKHIYELLVHEKLGMLIPSHSRHFDIIRRFVDALVTKPNSDAVMILSIILGILLLYISSALSVVVIPFYVIPSNMGLVGSIVSLVIATAIILIYVKQMGLLNFDRSVRLIFIYILSCLIVVPTYKIYYYSLLWGVKIIGLVILILFQTLALLLFSMGISVILKMSFRRSIVLPLFLHYGSGIIVYIHIV